MLTIYLLAALSNMRGPVAAAEYAQALSQNELKSLGGWWNKATGRYQPPTKSTIHRVVMDAPEALEAVQRYAKPRLPAPGEHEQRPALAADGKRIRGANRLGTLRYETAPGRDTTGVPLASLNFHDQNGELAAVGRCWRWSPSAARCSPSMRCTPPATPPPASSSRHVRDYLLTVKKNCPETYEALATMRGNRRPGASVKTRRRATGASTVAISKC